MTAEKAPMVFGWRAWGLGVMALGAVSLALGAFDPGQPVPKAFPDREALAYAAGAFMLIAGAAVAWRRTAAWAAAALGLYYALIVVILMNGRVMLAHPGEFGAYSGAAEQLAIAAAALIVYAANARIDSALAARLTRFGQMAFGVCALLFGGAHFFYMNLTIPLVPKWLPPSQTFWAWATGIGHIAAGVAILIGVRARLAAVLLTAMYASFTLLVHGPMLLGDPSNHYIWTENALNIALIGAAWVVAELSGAAKALVGPSTSRVSSNREGRPPVGVAASWVSEPAAHRPAPLACRRSPNGAEYRRVSGGRGVQINVCRAKPVARTTYEWTFKWPKRPYAEYDFYRYIWSG